MKAKLRSVNTKFWEDPFIEGLKPDEKLVFLYLLTNPLANMLGIYEITAKRISYDTGINRERIAKILKAFEASDRVVQFDDYIILPNWLKNQSLNTNMQKGALNIYEELPNWLKDKIDEKPLKAFESLRNAMLNMKGNMNIEDEREREGEKKIINIDFIEFWNLYDKKVGDKIRLKQKWIGLLEIERELAMKYIPAYKHAQPNKQFRKNPETFLNQRGWEHEIIDSKAQPKQDEPLGGRREKSDFDFTPLQQGDPMPDSLKEWAKNK